MGGAPYTFTTLRALVLLILPTIDLLLSTDANRELTVLIIRQTVQFSRRQDEDRGCRSRRRWTSGHNGIGVLLCIHLQQGLAIFADLAPQNL